MRIRKCSYITVELDTALNIGHTKLPGKGIEGYQKPRGPICPSQFLPSCILSPLIHLSVINTMYVESYAIYSLVPCLSHSAYSLQ